MPAAKDRAGGAPAGALTALPFGLLVLVGSFLLFQVELIMARLLLPQFGSSASVWTTCLMFYQGALFAGYLYAGRASAWIAKGTYRGAHVAFVLAPVLFFPFRITHPDLGPVAAILLALTLSAGLPFVALSTTSVVCQAWFTTTRHPRRSDPYFLYGLSNAGALLALFTYPFAIERLLDLHSQLLLWYAGYAVYVAINVWCVRVLAAEGAAPGAEIAGTPTGATLAAKSAAAMPSSAVEAAAIGGKALARVAPTSSSVSAIPWPARLQWLLLSAGANALLMVVTSVISMDAPVALIWILPLTLYLVTLIVCFAPRLPTPATILRWNFGGLAVAGVMMAAAQAGVRPELTSIGVQNAILFVACLLCHDRLVRSKPEDPRNLASFYLAISLGGWLGSMLIGLVAPVLFAGLASHVPDYVVAGGLILAAFVASDAANLGESLRGRPLRIAGAAVAATAMIASATFVATATGQGEVYGSRTFYGLYRVEDEGGLRRLYHGNTVHGVESLDPAKRGEPLAYYHADSPIGRFLADNHGAPVTGIVGLGVGALAAYQQPGQAWDYYEIDPEVEHVARAYFGFLAPADTTHRMILGDARLSLQKTPEVRYDVLVMDTFSSDFVPLHLITREAVALYLSKVKDGGVLFFHISNRLFDLDPILTRIGHELGVRMATLRGNVDAEVSRRTGRFPSIWYAMTKEAPRHDHLVRDLGWNDRSEAPVAGLPALWTDDYVNLFEAMK